MFARLLRIHFYLTHLELNLIKESQTITVKQMSMMLSVNQCAIERALSTLQNNGLLKREGKDY